MNRQIMVIDDEAQIQRFMKISLIAENFDYVPAYTAVDGLKQIKNAMPDLIILDLGLPDKDGSWLLCQIRSWSQVPILILTARDEEEEKVRLLNAGANDYLSKPFGIKELIARIRVLLRDLVAPSAEHEVYQLGNIKLDAANHKVWLKDQPITLTKKEFTFLKYLIQQPNALVTHQQLLKKIWGDYHLNDTHYLRVLVSQLRKKLEDDVNQPSYIVTEPGIGYRFINPDKD